MMKRGILMEETRKVLRASQMEAASARLSAIHKSCIPYSKFVKILQNKLMPLLTTLAHRFLHITKLSSSTPQILPLWSSSPLLRCRLQHHPIVHPALPPHNCLDLLADDYLIDRIHGLNLDCICLQGPAPSLPPPSVMSTQAKERKEEIMTERGIAVEEMEVARARLRAIQKSCIPYSEFVNISQNKLMLLLTTLARRFLHIALLPCPPDPSPVELPIPPPSSPLASHRLTLLIGDCLIEHIHGLNPDHIRLKGTTPPPPVTST